MVDPRHFFFSVPLRPLWGNKEMDQKKGLLLKAMPPIIDKGNSICPIARTYNVMITLVYPFLVVQCIAAQTSNREIGVLTDSGPQF